MKSGALQDRAWVRLTTVAGVPPMLSAQGPGWLKLFSDRQDAAHCARRADPAQDSRCGARGVRRTRLRRSVDRRHHAPRQGRARHLLHLLRQQGGSVPGVGRRHVRSRSGLRGAGARRPRPTRWTPSGARWPPSFSFVEPSKASLPDHRRGRVRRSGRLPHGITKQPPPRIVRASFARQSSGAKCARIRRRSRTE